MARPGEGQLGHVGHGDALVAGLVAGERDHAVRPDPVEQAAQLLALAQPHLAEQSAARAQPVHRVVDEPLVDGQPVGPAVEHLAVRGR